MTLCIDSEISIFCCTKVQILRTQPIKKTLLLAFVSNSLFIHTTFFFCSELSLLTETFPCNRRHFRSVFEAAAKTSLFSLFSFFRTHTSRGLNIITVLISIIQIFNQLRSCPEKDSSLLSSLLPNRESLRGFAQSSFSNKHPILHFNYQQQMERPHK